MDPGARNPGVIAGKRRADTEQPLNYFPGLLKREPLSLEKGGRIAPVKGLLEQTEFDLFLFSS